MVGYDETAKQHLTDSEYAVAGALAGGLTRCLTQPLDVIKIRFQLQVEPIRKMQGAKYWGMGQATKTIIQEEGLLALWKGHVPAQALSVVYGLCQGMCFEVLTRQAWFLFPQFQGDNYRPIVHFVSGGAAGVFASVISFPFDVVRTRLVAQGEPRLYRSMGHALSSILYKEGPYGLFRGLSPVLIQIAPHAGLQFSLYTLLKKLWVETGERDPNASTISSSIVIGALAGIGAKTAVYPLDLAKKRLQMTGFEEARAGFGQVFTCTSLFHCLKKTAEIEGPRALFKGLLPSVIKAAAVTALYFTFYEKTCSTILQMKIQER